MREAADAGSPLLHVRPPMSTVAGLPLQFARFLVVGVLNTVVGLTIIFAAKALLGWSDLAANAAGYAVGLATSFLLNRAWTFGDRGRISPALLRFLGAFVLAYLANLATVFALRDLAAVDSYVAQAAGVVPYTILFFLASRAFVFLDHRPGKPSAATDPRPDEVARCDGTGPERTRRGARPGKPG